jgi:mannosyltransferase
VGHRAKDAVILLLLAAAVALAAFLRFDQLGVPCYWLDEILGDELTTRAAATPLWRWITGLEREHGPLYYASQLAERLFGRDEWAGRLVPALCGVAAVAIAGLIARKAGQRASGIFAAAVMTAISPLHVYFSREARPYGLVLLLTAIAILLLLSATSRLAFAITLLALVYTSAVTGPVVAAIAVTALVSLPRVARTFSPPPGRCGAGNPAGASLSSRRQDCRRHTGFAIIPVAALALFPLLYRGAPSAGDVPVGKIDTNLLLQIVRAFTVSALGNPGRSATVIATLLFAIIGGIAATRRDRRTGAVLIAMAVLPVAFSVATLHAVGHWFAIRYVIAGLPAFLVLAGIGIAAVASLAGVAELAFTIVIAGALSFDLIPAARREPALKLDWRSIAATLESHARPGDIIIAGEPWSGASLAFYLRHLPPGVKFEGHFDLPSAMKKAQGAKAAWLVSGGLWGYGSVREWMCGYPIVLSSPLENFRLHFAPAAGDFVLRHTNAEDVRAMTFASGERSLLLDVGHSDELLLSSGWGTREGSGDDAFRWVTAREASVTFAMHGRDARTIRLQAMPASHPSLPPQTMHVLLNGTVLAPLSGAGNPAGASSPSPAGLPALHEVTMQPFTTDYTFMAPTALWRDGLNVLTFSFGRATAPATLDPSSTDRRTLAAAIHRIVIGDPNAARSPVYAPRLASASLLDVRCPSLGIHSRFDHRDYDRAGVEALLARLGFDPVGSWPRVAAGDYTIEEIANTAALDNACVSEQTFIERAFAALLARSPNSVERRDLLARMRTGTSRSQIVARILRADGFRQSVLRVDRAAARGRS